jgi:hypothetical protein
MEHDPMPRGGRRPGAGAPKGNLNALRGGAFSERHRIAFALLECHPDRRQLAADMYAAGLISNRRNFKFDMRKITRYLYQLWVDRFAEDQSVTIDPPRRRAP